MTALTVEMVEEWRANFCLLYAGEVSNLAGINALCNAALAHLRGGEPVAWMVTRDSECDPPEFFLTEKMANANACLGVNSTRVTPLYKAAPAAGEVSEEMVNRFLSWKLPDSVCSDTCVTERDYGKAQGYPPRSGTNLLTADEARQMLEYVLSARPGEAESE